ncbi:MAG: elongation factor Ts [Candidatus Mesenet longicola]|uniref:Elongation factor Ts n=1 Tax=Candidatus Mesenet longicola TaxID=1892558 RepID=A0A8J3HVV0_9RICK|nr:MAG: elongation factor Ts [Candidatus Mesenet longicola]GHM59939.1 MAG: elongation factor Ts [Candidatus Mesenet longicola]
MMLHKKDIEELWRVTKMSNININDIKILRDKTSAGMSDCKEALKQCGGDIESAAKYLREKGLSNAQKKIDKEAKEGVIIAHIEEKSAAMVALNCESDFVARSSRFQVLAEKLVLLAHRNNSNDLDSFKRSDDNVNSSIEETIMNEVMVLKEKINLSEICYLDVKDGVVAGYVHSSIPSSEDASFYGNVPPIFGKIGALVALESKGDKEKLKALGKQLAIHIASMKPKALSVDHLDQKELESERLKITEDVKKLGKPEKVMENIISGRIAKYYEEVVLLEQFFLGEKIKVADLIKLSEAELNCTINLVDYKLFTICS